jgi:hypothetical protein
MDHCPSGDNPGEGNNRNICIVDDDINDIIYIDSDSESSVKICDQKLSSFANDEVEYVKTAAKMAKPPRIRSGQHKAPFSPKDKIGSKLAHRQDKFLSPRKRRTSTSVLSSTMNTNEPKAVKHASNPSTNFSRTNERANNLSEEKNVSSRAIAGSEESLKESKQSSLSAVEQFRSYFGLSSSKNRGPRSPPPFGFDSSQSVADSSFSRPSTPPVDWQISDEGQALTSVRNGSQPVKDDRNVTLLSPFFDSASLKENKTVTKSVVFSSEAERGNAVLPSDSERSCVATDCERGKQELAIQIDSFDDVDSDSSSCVCIEIARSPLRKVHGRSFDEAIFIASSSDDEFNEDLFEDCGANSKRDLSLLHAKKFVYRENNKGKSSGYRNEPENSNEICRRVNLLERKEERRLQAVLARGHENLMSPGRLFCINLDGPQPRVDGSQTLQFSESSADPLLASNSSPEHPSSFTQNAGETTQQCISRSALRTASLTASPSSSMKDSEVLLDDTKAVNKAAVSKSDQALLSSSQLIPLERDFESSIVGNDDRSRHFDSVLHLSKTEDNEWTKNVVSSLSKVIERQESLDVASQPYMASDLSKKNSSCTNEANDENVHSNTDMDVSVSTKREKRLVGLKKTLRRASIKNSIPLNTINFESRVPPDQCSVCSDEEDMDLPACMLSVHHWSRKYLSKTTNLPVWEFTVYGGDDCKCHVRRSYI